MVTVNLATNQLSPKPYDSAARVLEALRELNELYNNRGKKPLPPSQPAAEEQAA